MFRIISNCWKEYKCSKPVKTVCECTVCQNKSFLKQERGRETLTVSNSVEVTEAFITPPILMFARTGASNPIEES